MGRIKPMKAKTELMASLGLLNALALKKIFDKRNFSYEEEVILEEHINLWIKKDYNTATEKKTLGIILESLIGNEDGKFNSMKETFARHHIDYRKAYGMMVKK